MKKYQKVLFTIMYWTVSLTWGALMTWPGLIICGVMAIFCPHQKNGCSFMVFMGGNWGGLDVGATSITGDYRKSDYLDHLRRHEFGHSIQQLMFGPLQVFLVAIPSAVRYWYQRIRAKKGLPNKDYDAIWFEGTATKWGTYWIDKLEG